MCNAEKEGIRREDLSFQTGQCVSFRDNIKSICQGWKDQGIARGNWIRLEDWKRRIRPHLKHFFIKPHFPTTQKKLLIVI